MERSRFNVEKIEPLPNQPGMVCVWSGSRGWRVPADAVGAFCAHMDDWYSVMARGALTRTEYERECSTRGITPVPDDDIGGYADDYGDYGMAQYHTDPSNWLCGIAGTLRQQRWWGILREYPDIRKQREIAEKRRQEAERVAAIRSKYPADLGAWIRAVGGLDAIYHTALYIHTGNPHVMRESGRHFEWALGHACLKLGMDASMGHPGYRGGTYPLAPDDWWGGWDETDPEHPINRLAAMLSDRRIDPYTGPIKHRGYGFGEDCGDDVRQNAHEWLGVRC